MRKLNIHEKDLLLAYRATEKKLRKEHVQPQKSRNLHRAKALSYWFKATDVKLDK